MKLDGERPADDLEDALYVESAPAPACQKKRSFSWTRR